MKPFDLGSILPKRLGLALKASPATGVSEQLLKSAREDPGMVLAALATSVTGLTQEEAEWRLEKHGPNAVAQDEGHGRLALFGRALLNPLVVLLAVLATVSLLTGDARAAIVMSLMIVLGVSLRFVHWLGLPRQAGGGLGKEVHRHGRQVEPISCPICTRTGCLAGITHTHGIAGSAVAEHV